MVYSLSVSCIHRPILPKKHSISYRGSKIVMKNSKCSDSDPKSLDDVYIETMKKLSKPPIATMENVYDETIKKMYKPAIEPIIEQLNVIDKKFSETDDLLNDINSKLTYIIDKIDKSDDYLYTDDIREPNDV